MYKSLVCLLFISLTPTVSKGSVREELAARPESAQASSESMTPTQKRNRRRSSRKKVRPKRRSSQKKVRSSQGSSQQKVGSSQGSSQQKVGPSQGRGIKPIPSALTPNPTPAPPQGTQPPPKYIAPVYDEGNPAYAPLALTGTFRLNVKDSDKIPEAFEQFIRFSTGKVHKRTQDDIQALLEAPSALAIERRENTVNLVTTSVPQTTFKVDGREHLAQLSDGNSMRRVAKLEGAKLVVTWSGAWQRDYKIVFEPIEDGRLRVTRHFSDKLIETPIVFQTTYDRVSDVAQFSSFWGKLDLTKQEASASHVFIVPKGELLTGTLDDDLTTKEARKGDRFTMTVRAPSQYHGAIIEGRVTNVQRSGRVTGRSGMALNFDTIRLPNGETYRFVGLLESIQSPDGDIVKLDNEGSVRAENQTTMTAGHKAAGAGSGAILGAVLGSSKGAAIGAAIGAGIGEDSVYVQGKNDLEFKRGSELTVRASGPR